MKKKFLFLISLILLITAYTGCSNGDKGKEESIQQISKEDNYRTFYQIFVGSFSDSNRDGIGDLRGVINRFDYLNNGNLNSDDSLGIQGIWLSPIFSSPSYHKYDATNYYSVDWRFGTEEDLKELIKLCDERNVKLILDLVLNHTSNSHEWFLKFKEARINGDTDNKYYNYYSCATTAEKVGGLTYQKIAGIDCWYECNFSGDMPELNYDNEEVKQEMLNVAKYYLDLGVDGFRFDAIKYIYYGNTDKSVDFWEWYMGELKRIKPDIYCVGECWSGETEVLDYYSAMNCFNFAISQAEGFAANAAKGKSLSNFTGYVESFYKKIKAKNPNGMPISFLSNHDMDRIAGAFVTENNAKMAASLYLLSPGSPFIYYGEEIGIRGSRGSSNTDANRRLAMLWGDDDYIKDPVGSTYSADKQISTNVAAQLSDSNSMLKHYQKLIKIRNKYPAIARGEYNAVTVSGEKYVGGFIVNYADEKLVILHNNSSAEEITIDLSACSDLNGFIPSRLVETVGCGNAELKDNKLVISPQTSVVLQ